MSVRARNRIANALWFFPLPLQLALCLYWSSHFVSHTRRVHLCANAGSPLSSWSWHVRSHIQTCAWVVMRREWVEGANAINRAKFYYFFLFFSFEIIYLFIHLLSISIRIRTVFSSFFSMQSFAFAAHTFVHWLEYFIEIYLQWHIKRGEQREVLFSIVPIVYFIIIIIMCVFFKISVYLRRFCLFCCRCTVYTDHTFPSPAQAHNIVAVIVYLINLARASILYSVWLITDCQTKWTER